MPITRNIVPRVTDTGQLGTTSRRWDEGHFQHIYADTITISGGVIPPGAVFPYAGIDTTTPPTGYLFCHGGSYLVADYGALFTEIEYRYGGATTTFYVPDYQGVFLRGHDNGRGLDPDSLLRSNPVSGLAWEGDGVGGDEIGSYQLDAFKSHYHYASVIGGASTNTWLGADYAARGTGMTTSTGGNETRPVNMYVSYIIKY